MIIKAKCLGHCWQKSRGDVVTLMFMVDIPKQEFNPHKMYKKDCEVIFPE